MNWRLEVAIVLVFTLAFVGLGVMVATPVDSATFAQVHFTPAGPRPRARRLVLGHRRRGKKRFRAVPGRFPALAVCPAAVGL